MDELLFDLMEELRSDIAAQDLTIQTMDNSLGSMGLDPTGVMARQCEDAYRSGLRHALGLIEDASYVVGVY